ncbi:MAG: PEGA domain-containing protein [Nitrospirae bacterium]|nr:PEGA domain-containing protein [Nitrospirota bacterium]MBF0590947.1 PEGA domain-containing protein [Nitrospirota bacterium]
MACEMRGLGFFFVIATVISLLVIHYGLSYSSSAVKGKKGTVSLKGNARTDVLPSPTPNSTPPATTTFPSIPFKEAVESIKDLELPEEALKDKGAVIIKSDPASARLYLGGRFLGYTPYKLTGRIGRYKIVLKQDGYSPKTDVINVSSGKTVIVKINM